MQLLHIIRNIVTLINPQINLISPQVMYFHIIHRVVRKKLANLMRIERFQLKNKLIPVHHKNLFSFAAECLYDILIIFLRLLKSNQQIESILPCICPVIDHKRRQNVIGTENRACEAQPNVSLMLLPHFGVFL